MATSLAEDGAGGPAGGRAAGDPRPPRATRRRLRLRLPPRPLRRSRSPSRPLLPSSAAARSLLRSLHRLPSSRPASSPSFPSLAAFEWAPRATIASSHAHGLAVSKSPFVALSIAESGDTVAALGGVPACVNIVGDNHIVVEAAAASGEVEEGIGVAARVDVHASRQHEEPRGGEEERGPDGGRALCEDRGRRAGLWKTEDCVELVVPVTAYYGGEC